MGEPVGRAHKPPYFGYPSVPIEEETLEEIQGNLEEIQEQINEVDKKIMNLKPLQIFERIRLKRELSRLTTIRDGYQLDIDFHKSLSSDPAAAKERTIQTYERLRKDLEAVESKIKDIDLKIRDLEPHQMIEKFKLNRRRKRLEKERILHKTEADMLFPQYKTARDEKIL